jgi:metal-sulfur cluster biosynthetic enzyme
MNEIDHARNDLAVLQCLRDVVDLDMVQNVVELGLVISATKHETTIVVSLEESSEQSVVQGVLAALETAFPGVVVFNVVRRWQAPK